MLAEDLEGYVTPFCCLGGPVSSRRPDLRRVDLDEHPEPRIVGKRSTASAPWLRIPDQHLEYDRCDHPGVL